MEPAAFSCEPTGHGQAEMPERAYLVLSILGHVHLSYSLVLKIVLIGALTGVPGFGCPALPLRLATAVPATAVLAGFQVVAAFALAPMPAVAERVDQFCDTAWTALGTWLSTGGTDRSAYRRKRHQQ